jgi:hypothetical protein
MCYTAVEISSHKRPIVRATLMFSSFVLILRRTRTSTMAADANKNKFKLNSREISEEIIKITTQGTRMMDTN